MRAAPPAAVLSALLAALLWARPAAAQAPFPGVPDDCGLEPPETVTAPPVARKPREPVGVQRGEPPRVVRAAPPAAGARGGVAARPSGAPQLRARTGALSGKTVYLSAGHGFTRSDALGRWATQRGNTHGIVEDLVSAETVDQLLAPLLMGAGATVVPVREADLNPHVVVVNNGATGYAEEGPPAHFSTSPLPGWGTPPLPLPPRVQPFTLGGSRVMRAAPAADARAIWTPRLPATGDYAVYVAYAAHPGRVPDAHYVVRHAGGEAHFRVNQRRHGGTWVLLGRFRFEAGAPPERASVVALNDSTAQGDVSLDAVRFGGGRGLTGDAAMGPSGRPRFEESARYHVQFSGAPPDVFNPSGGTGLASERTDDVAARSRFAAWDHEDGEDAAYVAWHTNALNGATRGTEAYVYGPNAAGTAYTFTGAPGSDVLGQLLLTELTEDVRAAVDPAWRSRVLRSANFGELNPRHNPEMPAVLMEVAYHDQAEDAAVLREPHFRHVAARALVHGLIRYFAQKDGRPVHLPPEAPAAVAARNVAGGAELRWAAPPAGAPGGDAAERYRVYQSADGAAWDEGQETAALALTVALSQGQTRYFRVAAVNAGGEGPPSEVVGVRAGAAPAVLVVNGFDRLDATLARHEALQAFDLGAPARVLLEAMNDGTLVRRHGDALARLGVAFDSATDEAVTAELLTAGGYAAVDWATGRGGPDGAGLPAGARTLLRGFVQGGGHLVLGGTRVARALADGDDAARAFLAEVLRASAGERTGVRAAVQGVEGGFLAGADALGLDDGTRGSFPAEDVDLVRTPLDGGTAGGADGGTDGGFTLTRDAGVHALVPLTGASPVLAYAGTELVAGVESTPGGRVLLLTVPLETLGSAAERAWLLGAFLARAGVLSAAPARPDGGADPVPQGGVDLGEPSAATDPAPPPPPEAVVRDPLSPHLPRAQEGGCGCDTGAAAAAPWLLLMAVMMTVQRGRRARGKRPETR